MVVGACVRAAPVQLSSSFVYLLFISGFCVGPIERGLWLRDFLIGPCQLKLYFQKVYKNVILITYSYYVYISIFMKNLFVLFENFKKIIDIFYIIKIIFNNQ